jgi:hypothetical protein
VVSRCLSAAGICFSVIRFPPRNWVLLAVDLPGGTSCPDLDGVTTFRTRELQPGWVPSLPRGRRCSSRPSRLLDRRLPLYRGQSLHPAPTSHLSGLSVTRHQRGFKQFTRPAFPSPVAARVERAALGLSPGLRTPPTKSRRRTPGWGQAIEARTWNYSLNIYIGLILQSVVHSQRATSRRTTNLRSGRDGDEHTSVRPRLRQRTRRAACRLTAGRLTPAEVAVLLRSACSRVNARGCPVRRGTSGDGGPWVDSYTSRVVASSLLRRLVRSCSIAMASCASPR